MKALRYVISAVVLGFCIAAGPAAKPEATGTTSARTVSKKAVGSKPAKTLVFDPMKIEGRIQKPKPIHLMERSKTSFGTLDVEEDFLPQIVESVEGDPF